MPAQIVEDQNGQEEENDVVHSAAVAITVPTCAWNDIGDCRR